MQYAVESMRYVGKRREEEEEREKEGKKSRHFICVFRFH